MPCADFTLWIADRLASNDWGSISELLSFVTLRARGDGAVTQSTVVRLRPVHRGGCDTAPRAESRDDPRISHWVDGIRDQPNQSPRGNLPALSGLMSVCGSPRCAIGVFRLQARASFANVIATESGEFKSGLPRSGLPAFPRSQAWPKNSGFIHLRSAACLTMSLRRGSPIPGTILPRLAGDYTLRQYGLSDSRNAGFLRECGFFEPASNINALGGRLKKDTLSGIAAANEIRAVSLGGKSGFLLCSWQPECSGGNQCANFEGLRAMPDPGKGGFRHVAGKSRGSPSVSMLFGGNLDFLERRFHLLPEVANRFGDR